MQARILMSRERRNHTLQPTALVHEAFMRISKQSGIEWQNRSHFYGIAAHLMRQILIEHARRHTAKKRGGGDIKIALEDVDVPIADRAESIVALDDALEKLAEYDKELTSVVEMKFFGGLTMIEIAEALGIGERSVSRKWMTARLWLLKELDDRK